MARIDYRRRATELGVKREFELLQTLRQGFGIHDQTRLPETDADARLLLGLPAETVHDENAIVASTLWNVISNMSDHDQLVAQMTWGLASSDLHPLPGGTGEDLGVGTKWMARREAAAQSGLLGTWDARSVGQQSDRVVLAVAEVLHRDAIAEVDAYEQYAAGVIAYARVLHQEHRDPALVRLRNNASLTLHVLGFQERRVQLGKWALEAATYLNDEASIVAVLIDDLGWANYLLGDPQGLTNIEAAIAYIDENASGRLPEDVELTSLAAKAWRHKAVIIGEKNDLAESDAAFDKATDIALSLSNISSAESLHNMAHISFARALRNAATLGVSHRGEIYNGSEKQLQLARESLKLVRSARTQFTGLNDQGRSAKCLTLEVRLLEALHDGAAAERLIPVRDRAIAGSVWSRPAARTYITGRT